MTDTNNTASAKGRQSNSFSLIDLLMIIMVVGVAMTLIIPLRQTRQHEAIVRNSLKDMELILRSYDSFLEENGYEPFDISMLNIKSQLDTLMFKFTLTDTAVVAVTNKLGNEDKTYYYDLRDRRFRVPKKSRDIIIDTWLP